MTKVDRWLLPDGIEELLPDEARNFEFCRRQLLDHFESWGYDFIVPPMAEFLDSLLTGAGYDLDLQTFKVTDQISGRMMGLRPDITTQIARIDAHSLRREIPSRFCYAGSVMRTKAQGFLSTRSPMQVGAELFGHKGTESDWEIICLMLSSLKLLGIEQLHLGMGHVQIYKSLVDALRLDIDQERDLIRALRLKSQQAIADVLAGFDISQDMFDMCTGLSQLSGGYECLDQARTVLAKAPPAVLEAIDELDTLSKRVQACFPDIALYYDLTELRGYRYHSGLIFEAYVPGFGQALAKGGRYDETGKVFGRARPATGFSADLRVLLKLLNDSHKSASRMGILSPVCDDASLWERITELRSQGEKVIFSLPGQDVKAHEQGCDRQLINANGDWVVKSV